jgi:hypothetical protein
MRSRNKELSFLGFVYNATWLKSVSGEKLPRSSL